jgi:hypothetical protein
MYQDFFGVGDGRVVKAKTCEVCLWFVERISEYETSHGCQDHESRPAHGELFVALSDGYDELIGMVRLDMLPKGAT